MYYTVWWGVFYSHVINVINQNLDEAIGVGISPVIVAFSDKCACAYVCTWMYVHQGSTYMNFPGPIPILIIINQERPIFAINIHRFCSKNSKWWNVTKVQFTQVLQFWGTIILPTFAIATLYFHCTKFWRQILYILLRHRAFLINACSQAKNTDSNNRKNAEYWIRQLARPKVCL